MRFEHAAIIASSQQSNVLGARLGALIRRSRLTGQPIDPAELEPLLNEVKRMEGIQKAGIAGASSIRKCIQLALG